MDTRTKILSMADARALAADRPLALVTGYFDVLRAAHIRDLANVSERTLLAVIRPHPHAILPAPARAELVAALRMIDYVVIADDREVESLVTALEPDRIVHLEDADLRRTRELTEHVQRRKL